jgi:hypothetical protein
MVMGKEKYVWVILVVAALVSALVFVKGFNGQKDDTRLTGDEGDMAVGGIDQPKPSAEANNVHSYVLEPESEYNRSVRAWITRARLGGALDSRGINNCLSGSYTESTPLIELQCKKRDLDGQIRPLKVKSLYIVSDEGGGGGYHVGGTGLRLELGRQPTDPGMLEFDREYNINGHLPDVECVAATNFGRTRTLQFRTPASLKEGGFMSLSWYWRIAFKMRRTSSCAALRAPIEV